MKKKNKTKINTLTQHAYEKTSNLVPDDEKVLL